ncbi:MAG: NAD(P)/FAD-dependent oxidoreductase [Aquabacterium sp.]
MRVLVIGGGAIGAAVALFLRRLDATVDVTVVEPDPGLALASSARSAASILQQFSTPLNVQLSRFGLALLRDPAPWLGLGGEVPDLGFVESGYLFLATTAAGAQVLCDNHAVQRAEGAPVVLLSADVLAHRLPWLRVEDVALASLGEGSEGWFDGYAFARAMAASARAAGAVWRRARVAGFDTAGGQLQAARLSDGSLLGADVFVNAAGPWAGAVGVLAGLPVPVHGRRRTVFAFSCPTALPGPTPLVVDPSGCWFRSEGAGFIGGWSPGPGDADPDGLPLDQPDLQQFDERLWPALAHRVPAFEALRRTRAWDGYYEVHPADHNALIGPHPACANFILCNGFSGHGLQHAAGAGRGVAEWIVQGRYVSLDLSALSPLRLAQGRRYVEQAVI